MKLFETNQIQSLVKQLALLLLTIGNLNAEFYIAAQYSTVVTNIALWLMELFYMANIPNLLALIFPLKAE